MVEAYIAFRTRRLIGSLEEEKGGRQTLQRGSGFFLAVIL